MTEEVLVIPRRIAVLAALALVASVAVVALAAQPAVRAAVIDLADPRATADASTLERQRTAAEHAIQRGHARAAVQLDRALRLTLVISAAEAGAIETKARGKLEAIRRDALAALGTRLGLEGPALDAYVTTAGTQLDRGSFENEPGVLLAPELFAIVARAGELFQQAADNATRQLTPASSPAPTPFATPAPTPTSSPAGGSPRSSPTPSPSPAGSPSPSPSPTRP